MLKKILPSHMVNLTIPEEVILQDRPYKYVWPLLNMVNMRLLLLVDVELLLLFFILWRLVIILLFVMMFMGEHRDIWGDFRGKDTTLIMSLLISLKLVILNNLWRKILKWFGFNLLLILPWSLSILKSSLKQQKLIILISLLLLTTPSAHLIWLHPYFWVLILLITVSLNILVVILISLWEQLSSRTNNFTIKYISLLTVLELTPVPSTVILLWEVLKHLNLELFNQPKQHITSLTTWKKMKM